jgi:DNA primase
MTAIAAAGSSLDTVRHALEAAGAFTRARHAEAFMASCPLHDDANPSLSVTWKPRPARAGGAVLMHCFSCQAKAADITAALGLSMADLFDEPADPHTARAPRPVQRRHRPAPQRQPRTPEKKHPWQQVRVYTYTTAAGDPVLQVIRQECSCGAEPQRHKRFLQRYRQGRQWNWKKPEGFTPVLYRARQLAAADPDGWVWLTEGEKDADSAAGQGLTATTNPQGAGAFAPELAAGLAGRRVAIVVDRDRAGYQRGTTLHALLSGHARQIQVLLPAVNEHKADLTDHITAGLWDAGQPFGGLIQTSVAELEHLTRTHE